MWCLLLFHSMCAWMIDEFGSASQRQHYLPRLCSMQLLASYCLTEPGAGSDAANTQATATKQKHSYSLSGTKVRMCVSVGVGVGRWMGVHIQ